MAIPLSPLTSALVLRNVLQKPFHLRNLGTMIGAAARMHSKWVIPDVAHSVPAMPGDKPNTDSEQKLSSTVVCDGETRHV